MRGCLLAKCVWNNNQLLGISTHSRNVKHQARSIKKKKKHFKPLSLVHFDFCLHRNWIFECIKIFLSLEFLCVLEFGCVHAQPARCRERGVRCGRTRHTVAVGLGWRPERRWPHSQAAPRKTEPRSFQTTGHWPGRGHGSAQAGCPRQ